MCGLLHPERVKSSYHKETNSSLTQILLTDETDQHKSSAGGADAAKQPTINAESF